MGACFSAAVNNEDAKNRAIEREQQNELKKQEDIIKLLLLGAGESGKSTIFKQMKILYGKFYDDEELKNLVPVVHNNIMSNFLLVLENAVPKGVTFENEDLRKSFIEKYDEDHVITSDVAKEIEKLWEDPGCQKTWAERSSYQVLDSLSYYCDHDNLTRISQLDYTPDKMDILQARVRTSGIVEEKYVIDGVQFTMFDVGGQRNERKKWIHCFDNVTAVIFVAAINEYDQVLYEDNRTKRMDEAIKLFDEIANSQWFRKTSMILFLNKSDIFEEKLFRIPYKVEGKRNEDFEGPYAEDAKTDEEKKAAIEAAQNHILSKFLQVKRDDEKEVYHHVTCATDTHNIEVVFNACKDIILRSNLVSSGFMQ